MKVYHILLDANASADAQVLGGMLHGGDIVVTSPGKELKARFSACVEDQLVHKKDSSAELEALGDFFKSLPGEGLGGDALGRYHAEVDSTVGRIISLLDEGMSLAFRDNSLIEYLNAFLVVLCAKCFAAALQAGGTTVSPEVIDGRSLIVCENSGGVPVIDWKLTGKNAGSMSSDGVTVIAGAYGRKVQGETVALGKRGSELTANIIGSVTGASAVVFMVRAYAPGTNYTEVTYEEAAQIFSSGNPLYPLAMLPARKAGIPIELYSLEKGEKCLTISAEGSGVKESGITGVVSSEPMTLFTVYGTGLLGNIGISSAIFGALARSGVNVHFISQASAEYSVSFAVKRRSAQRAEDALRSLISDTYQAQYNDLSYDLREVGIVSVFGYRMRNVPGISGKVYSAIGQAGINVIASSQGGEEMSISIVVDEKDVPATVSCLSTLKL